MKRLLLYLFSSFFLLQTAYGQDHSIIGTVRSADGISLSNAHILNINTREGAITDGLGKFQISVADTGAVLRISYVGYRPALYTITPQMLRSDERITHISITLLQQSTLLSAAVVSIGGQTVINGKRGIVLHDFSFSENGNILLMAENGIRYLVLTDEKWKEKSRLRVDKKGFRLFDDCLGNTHLFGQDSVYQINTGSGLLQLSSVSEKSNFVEEMAHCSTSTDSLILFSSYQKAGQEVYHYGFDRNTKKGIILQRVFDHEGLQDIADYFERISGNWLSYDARNRSAGSSFGHVGLEHNVSYNQRYHPNGEHEYSNNVNSIYGDHSRFENHRRERSHRSRSGFRFNSFGASEGQYFQSVSNRMLEQQQSLTNNWNPTPRSRGWLSLLSAPIYSPMFNLRDSIYVFDHIVGIAYVYTKEGTEARSFPTEHQETTGWANKLLPDANGQKLYARVKRKGKVFLLEIDLNNGAVVKSTYLKDAAFAKQLKIRNGQVFYLKEDRDILISDRLMKQSL